MKINDLALHHFSLFDVTPDLLLSAAAEAGFSRVCIFAQCPPSEQDKSLFSFVDDSNKQHFKSLLQDFAIKVSNIEFFQLHEDTCVAEFERALALGAELGASLAVTHIHDTQRSRALDTSSEFSDLAARYDIKLGLEFMGLTPGCRNLDEALWFVRQSGRRNVGVGVDALHLHLTGGVATDLIDIEPTAIAYAQLCDTHAVFDPALIADEARYLELAFARQLPGEGIIDLPAFVQYLPADTPVDIEVPYPDRDSNSETPAQYARRIMQATRVLLNTVE
ncbi:MAG: sugar phosphate isomerase/epimerase [Spongiibacteraceae bacterium]